MTNLACVLWWLVPGVFLGWLASWLFDLLFRRNGLSLIETAKSELAAVQAKASGLESELTVSRSQLSNTANEAIRLRSELSSARTAHEDAKGSFAQLKSELDLRNASLANYATDLSSLQSQFSNARQSYAQLEAALAAARAELDVSKRVAAGAQITTETTTGELNRLRAELATAVAAKETFQRSFASHEAESASAKTSLAQSSSELDRLKAELAAAKSALGTLQMEFDRSKTAVTSSSGEIDSLRAQIASLRGEHEHRLGLVQADLDGHKTSLAARTAEVDQLRADLASAQSKAGTLQPVQTEFANLKGAHEASERKLAELELQLAAGHSKHDEDQRLIALLQAEIESNKRANSALAGRAADMERAAHMEAERRIAMTRNGFVPRHRDRDDLTLIEGVGPKIEEVLVAAGIDTHAKLAVRPVEELRRILDAAGPQFNRSNPGTWSRQAALAVRGDWAELRRWQDELIAGVEIPKSGA